VSDDTFAAPHWLRELGWTSWYVVGFVLVVVGLAWLLGETFTIVGPLLGATIVAVVSMPIVDRLDEHMPRGLAAALVLVGLAAIAVGILLLVLSGIRDQSDALSAHLSQGVDRLQAWATDLGVSHSTAQSAGSSVKGDAPRVVSTLLHGVVSGIRATASLVFELSLGALSTFFLLKDGPVMRRWLDRHLGLPVPVAHTITTRFGLSLRGYFRGVTLIAAFNGLVVAIGALLLGVPLAGTIGVVTFVTAYIPFIGAFVAGTFAVVIALGAKGTVVALVMLAIVILANGLLQNLVQPFAMGTALDLNPLAVLVVTIGAGCLFGTVGLVLAGPVASAAAHIPGDLRRLAAPPEP
jgi:predicted PurR-regulated permease PerM